MDKVHILDKTFRKMISHEEIVSVTKELAEKLNREYEGCSEAPVLLCTLTGSLPFAAELMKGLAFDPMVTSMKVSSYSGTQSAGRLTDVMGPTMSLEGKDVIILEDIVDTGVTVTAMRKLLAGMGAKRVRVCTMLFKPEKFHDMEKVNGPMTEPEFVGKEIPNAFIIGFGLDYNEFGRCLKDIYVLYE